jgi:hypothetical protein
MKNWFTNEHTGFRILRFLSSASTLTDARLFMTATRLLQWFLVNFLATGLQVGIIVVTAPSHGGQAVIMTGLVFALVQLIALRHGLNHPWRWIGWSMLGWFVSLPAAIAAGILGAILEQTLYQRGTHLPLASVMGAAGGAATGVIIATFQLGALRTNQTIVALWPIVSALGGAVLSVPIACCLTFGEIPLKVGELVVSPLIYSLLTAPVILRVTSRPHS